MSDERSRLLSGGQSSTYNAFPDIDPPYNDFPDFPDFPDLAHHLERIEITGVRPRYSLKATSHILFWLQAALVVLFSCFGEERFIENDNFMNIYQLFTGVEIMSLIGFGYLRTFLKRYGMGALGFTLFVTVIGLQWGILTEVNHKVDAPYFLNLLFIDKHLTGLFYASLHPELWLRSDQFGDTVDRSGPSNGTAGIFRGHYWQGHSPAAGGNGIM